MWETTQLPDEASKTNPALVRTIGAGVWQENLQTCDLILVPCEFSKRAFENNGITVPIKVVPYGLDTDEWDFVERTDSDVFAVLVFGDLTTRKGPLEAIQAFHQAFGANPDVRLILKSHNGHFGVGEFGPPQIKDPRIMFIDERIPRESLKKLIHTADCFLGMSRGEGWSLCPLQAALSGLPVITTTHTGMEAWFDERYFYGVESPTTSPAPYGGEWFEPSVESAAQQLLAVYNDRKEARRKAKLANIYIRKNFNLEKFGNHLREIIAPL
jgi:glycosyltransferase involved in cell wall biosynthesis